MRRRSRRAVDRDRGSADGFGANEFSRIDRLDGDVAGECVADPIEIGVVETDEFEDGTYELDEERDLVADTGRLNDDLAERVFRSVG